MKKSNHSVGFKSGDIQLFEVLKLLGGASSLDTFLKAYETKKTKVFLPCERFDCPEKVNNKKFTPYHFLFSILRNNNPIEKDYNDFENRVNSGSTTEQAVARLRTDRIPPTGAERIFVFAKRLGD